MKRVLFLAAALALLAAAPASAAPNVELRLGCNSVQVQVSGLKATTVYGIQIVDVATGRVLKVLPTKSTAAGMITASGRVDLTGTQTIDAIVWDKGGNTKTMAVKQRSATSCEVAGALATTGGRMALAPAGLGLIVVGALLVVASRLRLAARQAGG
jgi:hypothetical protein